MALEAHVILEMDGIEQSTSFRKLGEAMSHLNEASFAGVSGAVVVGVGQTTEIARARVMRISEVEPTAGYCCE